MNSSNKANAFKRSQMKYRRQANAPNRLDDFDEFVDFSNSKDPRIITADPECLPKESDLYYQGTMYRLDCVPGFWYAPQALSTKLQLAIAFASVSNFCEKPHQTNIDLVPPKPSEEDNTYESMWKLWKEHQKNPPNKHDNKQKKKHRSFDKLSWATMGLHYDWTSRSYDPSKRSEMPQMIVQTSTLFARTALKLLGESPTSFTPSASIVNYYNPKSLMGGHRDDLELAFDKPIVSLSVGRPAVFLLGGKTKDDTPVLPILIRPGDVMIMAGDCRLNYHGMARILPSSLPQGDVKISPNTQVTFSQVVLQESDAANARQSLPEEERDFLTRYLADHRININVRQVYPDGQDPGNEK